MYERREELREQAASWGWDVPMFWVPVLLPAPPPHRLSPYDLFLDSPQNFWCFISSISRLLSAGCSYKHCQTGAVPMIYYNVRRNGSEENTQNWQHYPLSRNTISTCILARARCILILYKPTKLMVSLTSLAPPHLLYLPQVGKEKCPKLWRVILIRNISPNLASH